MEFRNIITFLAVAEQGSFTGAANQLGYVQSTVTIQIIMGVEDSLIKLWSPLFYHKDKWLTPQM